MLLLRAQSIKAFGKSVFLNSTLDYNYQNLSVCGLTPANYVWFVYENSPGSRKWSDKGKQPKISPRKNGVLQENTKEIFNKSMHHCNTSNQLTGEWV